MYSHIMVGSIDLDKSRTFYDALFEKEGRTDDKGRTAWMNKGGVFMIALPRLFARSRQQQIVRAPPAGARLMSG